jgi:hypothetical protein
VEFVEERYKRALRIAEEMGDRERQRHCLGMIADFGLRRGRYEQVLNAAQRRRQIVMELADHEELASVEAEIDLAQALSSDPDSKRAIEGGLRSWSHASISEAEVTVGGGGGILPMAGDRRPYPPIYDYYFWLDAPLLKLPIKISEKWSFSNLDGAVERLLEADNETVSVPAGRFERCVQVKSTVKLRAANEGSPQADETYNRSKGFREGEKWMWFAPGVGIVKAEHNHANGKRTIVELVGYHLTESSNAYFPLAIGDLWRYEWRDENGELLFKEQDRVFYKKDGQFYIVCSG